MFIVFRMKLNTGQLSFKPKSSLLCLYIISGFCCGVTEVLSVLGCYASLTGSGIPTFWDNLLIPSSETNR